MKQVNILYIGRNAEIKDTVVRLVNNREGWQAHGALTDKEALSLWDQQVFDIVLLGNGIDEDCEMTLRNSFKAQKEDIIIIQHYGGGSGLLYNEIMEAMSGRA